VNSGEFREDLYYRINGLLVTLPPLRLRTDLAVTVEKILRAERPGGPVTRVSPEVLEAFTQHAWPGNFRQLANVLRTACAMLDDDETTILRDHLSEDFFEREGAASQAHSKESGRLDDLALSAVSAALDTHGGNVSAAARMLGVSRNTLYRKMAALGELRRR
jgi:transcriptional regulator of acetoin/glycerol metabolism